LNSLFVNFRTVLKVAYFILVNCSGIQAVFCYHNYGDITYSGLILESWYIFVILYMLHIH